MSKQAFAAIANSTSSAANAAMQLAKAHPYKAGVAAVNLGGVALWGPLWIVAMPLKALGFGTLGPLAGT